MRHKKPQSSDVNLFVLTRQRPAKTGILTTAAAAVQKIIRHRDVFEKRLKTPRQGHVDMFCRVFVRKAAIAEGIHPGILILPGAGVPGGAMGGIMNLILRYGHQKKERLPAMSIGLLLVVIGGAECIPVLRTKDHASLAGMLDMRTARQRIEQRLLQVQTAV